VTTPTTWRRAKRSPSSPPFNWNRRRVKLMAANTRTTALAVVPVSAARTAFSGGIACQTRPIAVP
jgi:hypothetical protein